MSFLYIVEMRIKQERFTLYHLYNRGNRKCPICFDKEDFDYLLKLIRVNITNRHYDLLSMCIMPNHYHILLAQTGEKSIGSAMQVIACKYTRYFNKRYCYVGHLFQGSYKYKPVKGLLYFNWLARYIRSNPLEINPQCRSLCTRYFENKRLIRIYRFFFRSDL